MERLRFRVGRAIVPPCPGVRERSLLHETLDVAEAPAGHIRGEPDGLGESPLGRPEPDTPDGAVQKAGHFTGFQQSFLRGVPVGGSGHEGVLSCWRRCERATCFRVRWVASPYCTKLLFR